MDIVALINRVGSTRRRFAGSMFVSTYPFRGPGIMGEIELLRSNDSIYFEGGLLTDGQKVPTQFKFTLPFESMSVAGGKGRLSSAPLGDIQGTVLSTANGFEFLGHAGTTHCSLHLRFTGEQSFAVSGMFEFPTHSAAFSAEPATQWDLSSEAKIVSLHSRAGRK